MVAKKKVIIALALAVILLIAVTATVVNRNNKTSSDKPAPSSSSGNNVHLIEYSNDDGPTSKVILTGAIGDFGDAVSIHHSGAVNPNHNEELNLKLSKGSFKLNIAGLGKKISTAFSHVQINPHSCSGSVSAAASVPIVSDSGAGSYKGIAGNFNLQTTIDEVVPMKPNCDVTAAFLRQAIVTTGAGTVSFH